MVKNLMENFGGTPEDEKRREVLSELKHKEGDLIEKVSDGPIEESREKAVIAIDDVLESAQLPENKGKSEKIIELVAKIKNQQDGPSKAEINHEK